MKNMIDQFMWGFQPFRLAVESKTEAALSTIGLPVEVRVVLVGFARSDNVRHPVCVEPEDGPFNTGHLSGVPDRAEELYAASPESRGIYIDNPRLDSQRRASLRRRFRADALVEAIEASGMFEEFTFFASRSAPVGGYEVHTCVGVPTVTLDSLPAVVGQSLQHEVIAECLRRADRAIYLPDPGQVGTFTDRPENIVLAAARRFARVTVFQAGGTPTDLFDEVNTFTSLSYERAAAGGHLVVANHQNAPDRTHIRFQRPVSLRDSKIMRKLLELSDESTSVITDGQRAYGLGPRGPAADVAEITVRGHAEWDLSVDGETLMRVTYGKAKLPRPPLPRHKVDDAAQRILSSIDMDLIWPIIEEVRNSGHGTILVVSNSPEEEAARLGGQAVPIDPERLPPEDIARLGRVDGAVLLGPDGRCHAFGVILDGAATDPRRPGTGFPVQLGRPLPQGTRQFAAGRYLRRRAGRPGPRSETPSTAGRGRRSRTCLLRNLQSRPCRQRRDLANPRPGQKARLLPKRRPMPTSQPRLRKRDTPPIRSRGMGRSIPGPAKTPPRNGQVLFPH